MSPPRASGVRAKNRKVRNLIAADHPLIRKAVRSTLAQDTRFDVCGEAEDGAKAIKEAHRLKPDVVVLNELRDKLGPLLFQFSYFDRKAFVGVNDFLARLVPFLEKLPKDHKFAVEIRNKGWLVPQFIEALRERGVALALIDQSWIALSSFESVSADPDPLRKVSYYDAETNKRLKFLTNNFRLPALTIAQIYKQRWQVELFFKWIKQHLRIKAFYGTSENAVKTQIWIAVSIYVLVAILRKRLELEASLYQTLQILSVTLFEKTPILHALQTFDMEENLLHEANQLILFNL